MKSILPFLLCIFMAGHLCAQTPTITTTVGIPYGNTSGTGVAYGNSVYVSILSTGLIYTSTDGNDWKKVTDAGIPAGGFHSLAFGSGSFVVVGDDGLVISSANGQNWTSRTSGTTNTLVDVQFIQSKFYAVGNNATLISSADGIIWSPVIMGVGIATDDFRNITYGGGFFAIGASRTSPNGAGIYRSSTGASNSWTVQTVTTDFPNKVQYLKNRFFMFTSSSKVYTSTDAITWTNSTTSMVVTLPDAATQNIGIPNQVFHGIYDGSKIYMFGFSQYFGYGSIYSSSDGINFKLEPKTAYITAQGSAYINNKYFEYGNEGILSSSDGLNYKYPGGNYYGLASNGTGYVGVGTVGQSGVIFSSNDFSTWTEKTPASQKELNAVVYTGTKYVAAGNQTVVESTDGNSWTQVGTPADNFNALAFGSSKLVAGGYNSTTDVARIAYSANGSTWTTVNTATNYYFKIRYVNGSFFALGYDYINYLGVILHSTDGVTWTDVTPNLPYAVYYFNDVLYDGSKYHFMGVDFSDAATFALNGFFSVSTSTISNPNSYTGKGTISSPPAGVTLGGTYGEGAFAFSNGHFVGSVNDMANNANYVIYSSDGIAWTAEPTNENTIITGIVASGENFKLLGTGDGKITVNFGSVLPVTLSGLSASPVNGQSLIKWQTASEQNTTNFLVQQSTNGTAWKTIATVKAANNSHTTQSYQYLHSTPAKGINYYRLQQMDADGRSSFSKVVNVLFYGTHTKLVVYPNPVVNGKLNVHLQQACTLNLFNSNGALVLSSKLTAGSHQLNVNGLGKGIYSIQANNENLKIVIQ